MKNKRTYWIFFFILSFFLISNYVKSQTTPKIFKKMKDTWELRDRIHSKGREYIAEINGQIYRKNFFSSESKHFPGLDLLSLQVDPPRNYSNKFHWDDKFIIWEIVIDYTNLEQQKTLPISILICDPEGNTESCNFKEKFRAHTNRHVIYIEIDNQKKKILYGNYIISMFVADVKIIKDKYQIVKY